MTSELGTFFRQQRLQQGLTLGQLARLVGYKNIGKGANKITRFEATGVVKEDLLIALAEVLGIDLAQIEELMEQDRLERLRRWEEWINQPVQMQMIVRLTHTVYLSKPLPPGITIHSQAESFACEYAKKHRFRVCLVLSRRHSAWINAAGQVESRIEATLDQPDLPFKRLQGRIATFLVDSQ